MKEIHGGGMTEIHGGGMKRDMKNEGETWWWNEEGYEERRRCMVME